MTMAKSIDLASAFGEPRRLLSLTTDSPYSGGFVPFTGGEVLRRDGH